MESVPTTFWGKLQKDESDRVLAWHPLADHCADVAACFEALLGVSVVRRRLARLGGQDDLHPVQVARLSVLVGLHDLGKHSIGFQNKALARPSFTSGHVREVMALFGEQLDYPHRACLLEAIGVEEIAAWGDPDSESGLRLLLAAICHHGRPYKVGGRIEARWWEPERGLDPVAGVTELGRRAREWFPDALDDGPLLPSDPAFQHGFSGLVMLADWLGSDSERFFPFSVKDEPDHMEQARVRAREAIRRVGLDPGPARLSLGSAVPGFDRLSPFSPRPAQQAVVDLETAQPGSLTIVEAETGSGKTEAALARYLRLFHAGEVDGLYFALPTRTAASQIFRRVREAVARAFEVPETRPPVVQAVPGYIAVDDKTAERLPEFQVLWHDDPHQVMRERGWAAERPKRYLAGAAVVGTVDQALLSALMVGHAHLRASALLRLLLVVDEVHASDTYMNRILEGVLAFHRAAGGHALLMSATLGSAVRHRLLAAGGPKEPTPDFTAAVEVPFPAVYYRSGADPLRCEAVESGGARKQVDLELVPDLEAPDRLAVAALAAARRGARVLIVRNTVTGCLEAQAALEDLAAADDALLFHCRGVVAPHHARFAKEDREALDEALEARFGKEASPQGGVVLVATQTVQQSLDLDADILFSDLCPMDVLLQRIGRLHRHADRDADRPEGFKRPRVVVLVPAHRDLGLRLDRSGQARGGHGLGTVYDDLRQLEATWRGLEGRLRLTIPDDNRRLVEESTHPEVLDRIVAELGGLWPAHAQDRTGVAISDRQIAQLNLLDRSRPFGEVGFPDRELARVIQTRLGEADRLATLPTPLVGPFGREVRELTIPSWFARDVPADAVVEAHAATSGSLAVRVGGRSFVYDRWGLRPSPETVDA